MSNIGDASTFQALINLIKSKLGSAAYKNAPSSGNASNTEVVLGSDSRLSDSRTPTSHTHTKTDISDFPSSMPASDVYSWAKESAKPSYNYSEIGNTPTLGTAAAKDIPVSGNAGNSEVVLGNDTRLTDSRTPTSHTHTTSDISDFPSIPTFGTAATRDVPTSGDAANGEVVLGADSRLSDSRTPTSHSHTVSDITDLDNSFMAKGKDYVTAGNTAGSTVGAHATVEGSNNTATTESAHAEGSGSHATGTASHAEGGSTIASERQSHAEGLSSTASGIASHAENENTLASHRASHAEGYQTKTGNAYQHVQGKYNEGKTTTAFEIGKGTSNNARSNAFEVDWSGNVLSAGTVTDGNGNILSNKADSSSLGTAAALNVATSGNASTTEVVKGDDTRLSDSRTPTSHSHTVSDITDFPTLGDLASIDIDGASSTKFLQGDGTWQNPPSPTAETITITNRTWTYQKAFSNIYSQIDVSKLTPSSGMKFTITIVLNNNSITITTFLRLSNILSNGLVFSNNVYTRGIDSSNNYYNYYITAFLATRQTYCDFIVRNETLNETDTTSASNVIESDVVFYY